MWQEMMRALWREVDAENRERSIRLEEAKLRRVVINLLRRRLVAQKQQAAAVIAPIAHVPFRIVPPIKPRKRKPYSPSWPAAIKARDGACTECGATERLHAHHIEPVHLRPDLANDLANGTTLCVVCHAEKHPEIKKLMLRGISPGPIP